MQYTIVKHEGENYLTVFVPGRSPLMATPSTHANFDVLLKGAIEEDESILELFDLAETASKKFEHLSERVSVRNGKVYFDGDEVDNALSQMIVRFIEEDEDFQPLVNFFEKVESNPIQSCKEQLFRFLNLNGMVISLAEDGDIVAYKGMRRYGDDQEAYYQPTHHGHVIVDGVDYSDSDSDSEDAKQFIGSVIEMPRSEVRHDPSQTCSVGLHIATFGFAKSYGNTTLEVRVNPRDVVSVPNDAGGQKVRACRYKIIGEVTERYEQALVKDQVSDTDQDLSTVPEVGLADCAEGCTEHATCRDPEGYNGQTGSSDDAPRDEPIELVEDDNVELVTPSQRQFDDMLALSKRQKKGIRAVAPTRGWDLVGDNPKEIGSWRVRV